MNVASSRRIIGDVPLAVVTLVIVVMACHRDEAAMRSWNEFVMCKIGAVCDVSRNFESLECRSYP